MESQPADADTAADSPREHLLNALINGRLRSCFPTVAGFLDWRDLLSLEAVARSLQPSALPRILRLSDQNYLDSFPLPRIMRPDEVEAKVMAACGMRAPLALTNKHTPPAASASALPPHTASPPPDWTARAPTPVAAAAVRGALVEHWRLRLYGPDPPPLQPPAGFGSNTSSRLPAGVSGGMLFTAADDVATDNSNSSGRVGGSSASGEGSSSCGANSAAEGDHTYTAATATATSNGAGPGELGGGRRRELRDPVMASLRASMRSSDILWYDHFRRCFPSLTVSAARARWAAARVSGVRAGGTDPTTPAEAPLPLERPPTSPGSAGWYLTPLASWRSAFRYVYEARARYCRAHCGAAAAAAAVAPAGTSAVVDAAALACEGEASREAGREAGAGSGAGTDSDSKDTNSVNSRERHCVCGFLGPSVASPSFAAMTAQVAVSHSPQRPSLGPARRSPARRNALPLGGPAAAAARSAAAAAAAAALRGDPAALSEDDRLLDALLGTLTLVGAQGPPLQAFGVGLVFERVAIFLRAHRLRTLHAASCFAVQQRFCHAHLFMSLPSYARFTLREWLIQQTRTRVRASLSLATAPPPLRLATWPAPAPVPVMAPAPVLLYSRGSCTESGCGQPPACARPCVRLPCVHPSCRAAQTYPHTQAPTPELESAAQPDPELEREPESELVPATGAAAAMASPSSTSSVSDLISLNPRRAAAVAMEQARAQIQAQAQARRPVGQGMCHSRGQPKYQHGSGATGTAAGGEVCMLLSPVAHTVAGALAPALAQTTAGADASSFALRPAHLGPSPRAGARTVYPPCLCTVLQFTVRRLSTVLSSALSPDDKNWPLLGQWAGFAAPPCDCREAQIRRDAAAARREALLGVVHAAAAAAAAAAAVGPGARIVAVTDVTVREAVPAGDNVVLPDGLCALPNPLQRLQELSRML